MVEQLLYKLLPKCKDLFISSNWS